MTNLNDIVVGKSGEKAQIFDKQIVVTGKRQKIMED